MPDQDDGTSTQVADAPQDTTDPTSTQDAGTTQDATGQTQDTTGGASTQVGGPGATGSSFDVNWPDVELINQPTGMSCWAASAAMVVGWRDKVSLDPAAIASGAGQWAAFTNGLNPADIPTLATAWGLAQEPGQCYNANGLLQLLQTYGPLWVGAEVPGLHAIVVTGIYGDGTPDGTYVRINDPWDRDPGTPGNPGAYLSTHDHGSQYVLTLTQFSQEYDAAATDAGLTVQVLHAANPVSTN
ncbi:MAG: papain-like cysteine protease family protein [Terracidiphilus sp.]